MASLDYSLFKKILEISQNMTYRSSAAVSAARQAEQKQQMLEKQKIDAKNAEIDKKQDLQKVKDINNFTQQNTKQEVERLNNNVKLSRENDNLKNQKDSQIMANRQNNQAQTNVNSDRIDLRNPSMNNNANLLPSQPSYNTNINNIQQTPNIPNVMQTSQYNVGENTNKYFNRFNIEEAILPTQANPQIPRPQAAPGATPSALDNSQPLQSPQPNQNLAPAQNKQQYNQAMMAIKSNPNASVSQIKNILQMQGIQLTDIESFLDAYKNMNPNDKRFS